MKANNHREEAEQERDTEGEPKSRDAETFHRAEGRGEEGRAGYWGPGCVYEQWLFKS